MSLSKLCDFYTAIEEKDNLVIIPSGCIAGKNSDNTDEELRLLTKIRQSPDDTNPRDSSVSITLPYDKNIYNGNFSENEFSHSPKERAEMIYEAITTKNGDETYKYNNLYFTGGSNTEDVIFELDKLCKERGPLPQRKDDLRTYGFSDATQLHHYLGQRGISTPVYYSKGIPSLVVELESESKTSVSTQFELFAVNERASEVGNISGYMQPGNQAQVEDRMSHQTALFDDEDKYNFMVVEFGSKEAAEAFLSTSEKFESKLSLLLSKDTNQEAVALLKEKSDFPIFTGMPVGHGDETRKGKGIALFSSAKLTKTDKGYSLITTDKADDKVKELNIQKRRSTIKTNGGNETMAILSFINGSAGAVFDNLDNIQSNSSMLSIKIPSSETDNVIQTMEMSIKKLYEKGVINPETIKDINFICEKFTTDEAAIEKRLTDLKERYLPKIESIRLNEKDIVSTKNNEANKLMALRGISPSTKAPYKPKEITINPNTLRLYQDKKQNS